MDSYNLCLLILNYLDSQIQPQLSTTTQLHHRHHVKNLENKKKFNNKITFRNWFRTCYELNSMHELDSKFKIWAKNDKNTWKNVSRIQSTKSKFNTNLKHNVTIIMTKHDSKTIWNKWFTLRFLCFFFLINILKENLDLKVQHKNIMNENW